LSSNRNQRKLPSDYSRCFRMTGKNDGSIAMSSAVFNVLVKPTASEIYACTLFMQLLYQRRNEVLQFQQLRELNNFVLTVGDAIVRVCKQVHCICHIPQGPSFGQCGNPLFNLVACRLGCRQKVVPAVPRVKFGSRIKATNSGDLERQETLKLRPEAVNVRCFQHDQHIRRHVHHGRLP